MATHSFPLQQAFSFQGYTVCYHEQGQGRPLILLHNGGASHRIWQYQVPFFARHYRVLALDLLGFGESDRPDSPLTLPRYVAMLRALVESRELRQPGLMGNCIGAAIALAYSRQYPGEVASLVLSNLCGGGSMMRYFHPFLFPGGRLLPAWYYRWVGHFARLGWVRRQMVARLYGSQDFARDELYEHLLAAISHPLQPRSRLRLLQGMPSFDAFDHLPPAAALSTPALLFWGAQNRVLPLARGQRLIRALQPQQHVILPKTGHLLMAEAPEAFNQASLAFLQAR